MSEDDFSPEELAERVVYAGLMGVARWASAVDQPLKVAQGLLRTSYFHVLRRRGHGLRDIAERLGISERHAANLSRALKTTFTQPERAHTIPRRVEFVVWGEPLGEARICQALADVAPADVRAALDELLAAGRIVELPGRTPTYEVARTESRLPRDTWLARIDALDHLLAAVGDAVVGRFFRSEPRAFARTVSLRVRPEDLPALQRLYEETVWPALARLDQAAKGDPASIAMNYVVVHAPRDYIETLEEET